MIKHLKITITGRVQGVWFRRSAQIEAAKWGIKGFVENREHGVVYIEAEGSEKALGLFVLWCHKGPDLAKVTEVITREGAVQNFPDFQIRR